MKLKLDQTQFELLYSLLRHVRLGQDNDYSDAAFDLCSRFETKAAEIGTTEDMLPVLEGHFSEGEGIVLEFN